MPFETRKNISRMAISCDSKLLLVTDVDGYGLLVNFVQRTVIHRFNMTERVKSMVFSPCDQYVAISHGKHIQVWQTPTTRKEFSPFVLHRTYTGHNDNVVCINWSPDSRYFVTGSKDNTSRIYSLNPEEDFTVVTLTGHKERMVGCFMQMEETATIYTVCRNGVLIIWKWIWEGDVSEDAPLSITCGQWVRHSKHFLQKDQAKIHSVAMHPNRTDLMVVGFSNGVFSIFEMPTATHVQSLSVSQHELKTAAINCTGEWIALASSTLGQLLVWEWQSETYVLKQQGHFFDLNVCAYSPDGQLVATGGDDGKVKLWSTTSGFCFVTFTEHTAPITALHFIGEGNAVLSSSLDGTVRAFDLVRYKNFRTMQTPTPTQLTCMAVDGQGEIVCAGGMDPPEIYVWALQTGKLLDILAGHEGPLASLTFAGLTPTLASTSWDKTLRLWEPYKSTAPSETLEHGSDVLCVAFRPDGEQICTGTLSGQLVFWDVESGKQQFIIEGRKDISGGRLAKDRAAAVNSEHSKHFSSVCYTADGSCVIAGGRSKFVCIYEVSQQILLKKYQLSHNRSLDGVLDELNSKSMTEAGAVDTFNLSDDDLSDDDGAARAKALPGATRGDLGKRSSKAEIQCKCIKFSPNGQEWAAATTEGLIIFSLNRNLLFDPFQLEEHVTPDKVRELSLNGLYGRSLVLSLHLGENKLITEVYRAVPTDLIQLVARSVPVIYVHRMLDLIASELESSQYIERHLTWALAILTGHNDRLRTQAPLFMASFRSLQKALSKHNKDLSNLCNKNMYSLELLSKHSQRDELGLKRRDGFIFNVVEPPAIVSKKPKTMN